MTPGLVAFEIRKPPSEIGVIHFDPMEAAHLLHAQHQHQPWLAASHRLRIPNQVTTGCCFKNTSVTRQKKLEKLFVKLFTTITNFSLPDNN